MRQSRRSAMPFPRSLRRPKRPRAALGDHGRIVYVGAGTSGRVAVQDGAELTPTFAWPKERVRFIVAGGDSAFVTSIEGAEDDVDDASRRSMPRSSHRTTW